MSIDKRINLLTTAKIKAIYDYPTFSDEEQQCYFYLSKQELAIAKMLLTMESKIYFVLTLGYFKAKTIFYKINFRKKPSRYYLYQKIYSL